MPCYISDCGWRSWERIWFLLRFFASIFQDTHINWLNRVLNHLSLRYSVSGLAMGFLWASSFQIDFINVYSSGMVCVNTLLHDVDNQRILIFSWPLYIFEQWISFKITAHLLILGLISEHIVRLQSLSFILVWCFHMMTARSSPWTCLISTFWRLSRCHFGTLWLNHLLTGCMLFPLSLNVCTLSSFLDSLVIDGHFICNRIFFIFVETWFFLQTSYDLLLWISSFIF